MNESATNEFSIQREPAARYFYWMQIVLIIVVGVWFVGIGIPLALIHAFTLGPWLSRKQAETLRYWLDGTTLRVDYGVFFLKRKAIPLDRITDVVLAQGPLLRWCGIWELRVQTAGAGDQVPEASLCALADPETVRDTLLRARDQAVAVTRHTA